MKLGLIAPAAVLALAIVGCGQNDANSNQANTGQSSEAQKEAGGQTIAAGLDQNGQFFKAAKAVGLDGTLGGPGPYTVLVPNGAAFGKVEGALKDPANPQNRAELTRVLTYHILPGTVLAQDLGKAVDNGKGKALIGTMGGETITATKDGGKIVLTDSAGTKATVVEADQRRSNGVVHTIDNVLTPAAAPAAPKQQ